MSEVFAVERAGYRHRGWWLYYESASDTSEYVFLFLHFEISLTVCSYQRKLSSRFISTRLRVRDPFVRYHTRVFIQTSIPILHIR